MAGAAIFVIFPLCLAVAAFSDLFTMTIPNRIPAILMGSFFLVAPLAGLDLTAIGVHLFAGLVVFTICFILFGMNIMGGGDAKLLAASALWFGWDISLFEYVIYVSFLGGVLTVGILALRAHTDSIIASGLPIPGHLLTEKKVPYGISIGLAAFLAYPTSPMMKLAFSHLL
ncbi:A24 family peptidase [Pararhizobium sp.]|uniref:A24 family peptidase n=1 Tax=Pararhizobium sp. TaxID=1977563 RepID=UPI0027233D74|nr:prepilin peptidase [Pararhizobium sp.]MDO9417855.1 prepilin peptidase [Pararhizobium sp.]